MTCALRTSLSRCARSAGPAPVSTMYVVTFSGVTSGGMVTSGTTCWTCAGGQRQRRRVRARVLTCATKASLMSEVTMVLLPTPSEVPGQRCGRRRQGIAHRRRRAGCAHRAAWIGVCWRRRRQAAGAHAAKAGLFARVCGRRAGEISARRRSSSAPCPQLPCRFSAANRLRRAQSRAPAPRSPRPRRPLPRHRSPRPPRRLSLARTSRFTSAALLPMPR